MQLTTASVSLLIGAAATLTFVHVAVDVQHQPQRLDAADLDGDGDLDLAVLSAGPGQSATLQVLLNGNDGFSPGWSVNQPTGSLDLPWDVDLADTDGDGDMDILYVLPSGSPLQRFNDGEAGFDDQGFLPSFALRVEQVPADMDADGDVDVVWVEEDIIPYFGTLEGQGDGDFDFNIGAETFGGLGFFDLGRRFELGDVTGDGLVDAVMASKAGLHLVAGKPPFGGGSMPGWHSGVALLTTPCLDVTLADLDADGRLDAVASVPFQDGVLVLLGQPGGTFGPPRSFSAGALPGALVSADIDLDGHADVIVANPRNRSVSVLRGDGTGALDPPQALEVGRRPSDLVAADFDQDGDVDLAVTCAAAGEVSLLINDAR